MLPTKDPHQNKTPTQTESKGLEKLLQTNGQEKTSLVSNTYIRQNRLQNKGHKKRPRGTLHNTQGKNPSRRHQHYDHICTQNRSTQIYKENLTGFKKDIHSNTLILGDFNTVKNGYIFQRK